MKKINSEKILLIFIVLLPILDISSFLFRNNFSTSFSPSTFIRPLIPIAIILIIFFKNKFKLKTILIGFIYIIYSIIHLYCFSKLHTGFSYGSTYNELQYLINYSFSILNLFIFLFIFYKKDTKNINKIFLITNAIYILSIYLSIFTKTSFSTYLEGIGFKGWFESGNSISAILVLNLFFIFLFFNKNENKKLKIIAILEFILSGIYLIFLLGTRTGLLGFTLVMCLFIFSKLFEFFRNKIINKNFTLKYKIILISSCSLLICIALVIAFKGSSLLKRRQYLQSISNNIIDNETGKASNITGNVLHFKEQIENNEIDENYISKPMQKSILQLYSFARNHNFNGTDRRSQQLIFNYYLVKNQSNILYILFGNGFLNNYAELILEMEIPAFLFNFGLIGFILYFVPFLTLFIYYLYVGFKNIKIINSDYIFLLSGVLLSFVLSFLLGQLFFNSSAMVIIACINVLLFNKCNSLTSKTKLINEKNIIKEKEFINI